MLVLGIILIILGVLLVPPLFPIGVILAIVGAILLLVRPGGRYYY